ncbi:MAG: hypothetical protein PHT30_00465 [Bacilli bacterium]|nr:hypothetical protein [Bacilli bacterium]
MKNRTKIILASLISVALLSGCNGISAPSGLAIEDRLLSWNEVNDATGYRVLINEEDEIDVTVNELLLEDSYYGAMTFQVAALAGESVSEYSAVLSADVYLTLDAPSDVRQEGNLLMWDEVMFATGYVVKVGTIENLVAATQYQITSSAPVQVAVLANGSEDGYVLPSSFSTSMWFKVALQTPTNLAYSNGLLTWNAVDNASSYQVIVNDGSPLSASINQYNVGFDNVGSVTFKVKAISANEQYLDSAFAEIEVQIAPLTLTAPQNLAINGGVLSYDTVEHATAYGIYHNDVFLEETTSTQYAIPSLVLAQSGSYLQVQARSTIHNDSALSVKVYLGATEISNETQLRDMSLTGYYLLTQDIFLTSNWIAKDFNGVLDGNGHEISGLILDESVSEPAGFFKTINEALITNITIAGSLTITATQENISLGGLAGIAINSEINEVNIDIDINVSSINGLANVGGLVGLVNGGHISNSQFAGTITSENALTGGLVGKVSSSTSQATLIENSGSEGTIVLTGGEQSYAGGFVGLLSNNNAVITVSRSSMDVSGTSYVGGFVGYMAYGEINNSYSRGSLDASSTNLVHAGGFAGRVEGYNNLISYSLSMMSILISQSGDNIFIGSFAGVTPGGSYADIYDNCHYDSTLSSFDRIGNTSLGRGDGITGLSTSGLLGIANFNSSIWSFAGSHPMLLWEF